MWKSWWRVWIISYNKFKVQSVFRYMSAYFPQNEPFCKCIVSLLVLCRAQITIVWKCQQWKMNPNTFKLKLNKSVSCKHVFILRGAIPPCVNLDIVNKHLWFDQAKWVWTWKNKKRKLSMRFRIIILVMLKTIKSTGNWIEIGSI